jgi:phosphoribosylformimino-5-aminoimidazole carboxamide ribotide isomerase
MAYSQHDATRRLSYRAVVWRPSVHIVPVIDIRVGAVVQAVGGERNAYRPIETPLASSAAPLAVATGLLALARFDTLYIADLDGIEGRGCQNAVITALAAALPDVALWIDDGSDTAAVIGSESLASVAAWEAISARRGRAAILSLDFRDDRFLGPQPLLDQPSLWPDRVIAMTLGSVGRAGGPALPIIADIAERAGPGRTVYGAGGLRDAADLRALRAAGARGALIATALHRGTIKPGDIEAVAGL